MRIRFNDLPRELREHLLLRVSQREISISDLERLQVWARSLPEAPAGAWYKDFGSFILCGTGEYPKTLLAKGMAPFGQSLD